jgi:hypothetical protein
MESLEMIIQTFGEESMNCTRKVQTHHKEFTLAGQAVDSSTVTVTFHGDRMKLCKDFAPDFGDKRTCRCITKTHPLALLRQDFFFTKNNMTIVPTHPAFLFPRLKTKLKGHRFDTTEVTEAESGVVLNALTEHDFHDAF